MLTENWMKSTRSGAGLGDCVEARWVKASASHPDGGNCVEVQACPCQIQVRDSKDRTGPVLTFTPSEWQAFLHGARDGEFDI